MIVGRWHTERFGRLLGTDPGEPFAFDGKEPCVVAFHGFTGTTSEIRPALDRLAAEGHAVRAPLLPGHGSTAHSLQEATFDTWVDAMSAEVAAASARSGRFVLLGFSLGSLVALEIAARQPEGLVGLVLLGNAIMLTPPIQATLGFVDRRGWQFPDWYLLKLWSADIRDPAQRKAIRSYDRDPLRAALEVYRAGRRVEPRLPLVTCPTLLVHGGKDRVCPPANLQRVAGRLGTKDVTTKLYPNSAHLIAADVDRADVADEIARFVARTAQRVPVDP
jgi:carboxylesterase